MELYINGKFFSKQDILTFDRHYAQDKSPYEIDILDFVRSWYQGQENFILQTSGSTGLPKSLPAERRLLELSAQNTIQYLNLQPDFKCLICLNTAMIAGKMMLIRCLLNAMPAYIVEPHLDPFDVYNVRFDFGAVVPLQLEKWLQQPRQIRRLNDFQVLIVGGAALNQKLKETMSALKPQIYETYGMTETYSHIALKNIKEDCLFTTIYEDLEIALDERSCLKIKGEITRQQWLQTNDIVNLVGAKQFELLGRADFVINSGGIKISPEQIESILAQHLQLSCNYVVSALPDERLGEAMVLVIESDKVPDLDFGFLEKYYRPKKLIALAKFPLTNSGKIDRMKIKKIIFTH